MTRTQKITAGKIWQVYADHEPEAILFEGVRTRCTEFVRANFGMRAYKTGKVRIGQVIYEPETVAAQ